MSRNRKTKKNKGIPGLIILLGTIVIFAYITLNNGGLDLKKTNFTEVISKLKNIKTIGGENSEAKSESTEKTENSDKQKKLEKIRAAVETSKQAAISEEKQNTEENRKEPGKQKQTKLTVLEKLNEDLGGAYLQVETPKEKQIISKMRSTVSKLQRDASYNSSSDQASVKNSYSKLDKESKNRVKVALFTNIDGDSVGQLNQIFGL
ncbi:hypothetical protein K9O30_09940 [Clostridium bowmanii]|uniref:hypothetical protein n=1 Tax=Clostridium bowmanii TaxID=132925 RepID=UPI001C0D9012|nr:hypothetical protein [Clostridium bowmanii]MBU3189420.1 hypothetical protein [Clostridium bowmanii]MCA1074034.1 hypothetical protein [Clostridium bowmanii]